MTEAITLPMPTSPGFEAETPPPDWLGHIVEELPTGAALFDRELRYIAANTAWLSAFGLTRVPLAGQRHHELAPLGGPEFLELQRRALAGEAVRGCDTIETDRNGLVLHRAIAVRPRLGRNGTVLGVVAVAHEIVAASAESPRPEPADGLTGIPGRGEFLARVRAAVEPVEAPRRATALFLLDIENFKGINALYGARTGDRVLKTVASRLRSGVRSRPTGRTAASAPDLVARLGADEFGIVLGGTAPAASGIEAFAKRLLQLVAAPVNIGEQRIRLAANIGFIVTSPAHRSEDEVVRDLNIALDEAKQRGPNAAKGWEPALTRTTGRRLALLDELRRAYDEGEFVLHYQPIHSLTDAKVVGAEALLRWKHPSDGLIPPGDFLPLLEESGLIVPVGCWVIREVVRQMQVWQMLYGRDMLEWVSINVSARQFNDPSLLLETLSEINDSGFPLDRLKLEITESAVMRNPELTSAVLDELQELGIRVALDDFGTGYSALGALRHYNLDTIKIDREFTTRLDTHDGRELMLALLKIARLYGASVITEGIETAAQRDILRQAGCTLGQGFLFAKPMESGFFGAYALTHLVEGAASG